MYGLSIDGSAGQCFNVYQKLHIDVMTEVDGINHIPRNVALDAEVRVVTSDLLSAGGCPPLPPAFLSSSSGGADAEVLQSSGVISNLNYAFFTIHEYHVLGDVSFIHPLDPSYDRLSAKQAGSAARSRD
jgi:hypothetical protein